MTIYLRPLSLSWQKSPMLAALVALSLSACGPAIVPQGIDDPFEKQNRATHELNLKLDTYVVRPLANRATRILPEPVVQGVSNFAGNLDLPGMVVNDLLQAKVGPALQNTLRFAVNSTIGIGGVLDPASQMGAAAKDTDFGETLSVWGLAEGAYLELPFYGPSTQRDAVGTAVDLVFDPTRLFIPKNKRWVSTLAQVAARIGDRGRYSETVDSILYDSADGYAQARLLYLENRRHNLGQTTADSEFEDPYAH
ncbi:MAG: VacJ family lipoprotein [Pseudomonadota bacterium]